MCVCVHVYIQVGMYSSYWLLDGVSSSLHRCQMFTKCHLWLATPQHSVNIWHPWRGAHPVKEPINCVILYWVIELYLRPTETMAMLWRLRRHQSWTDWAKVAENKAWVTDGPVHAWYTAASWSLKPRWPSSKSRSLSSTTSHSTLEH